MFTARIKNDHGFISEQAVFYVDWIRLVREKRSVDYDEFDFSENLDNPQAAQVKKGQEEDSDESVPSYIEFKMRYYHNGSTRQQNAAYWRLRDEDEETITVDLDEFYANMYDRAQGQSPQQKLVYVAEQYAQREIINKR